MGRSNVQRNRLVLLSAVVAIVLLVPDLAYGQEDAGLYALVKHDLPDTLAPGQTFVGHTTWKIIRPGNPLYGGPVTDFSSLVEPKAAFRLPGDKMTPWHLPREQAAGDVFQWAFTLAVPLDFPAGEARISLLLARKHPEKGWQYAPLQDSDGKALGGVFRWALQVEKRRAAVEAVETPLVVGRMAAPAIDGRVEEAEWAGAGRIHGFVENYKGGAPKAATRAYTGYDDSNLYLAFVCDEPLMEKAARRVFDKHDASLWNNECVEIFLDVQGDRVSYVHFIVDILNQRFDALGADTYGYNPGWQSAVAEADGQWSVEIALPFSSLGVECPASGASWIANFCRERKAENELSAWRPTYGAFSSPGRFGRIVFGSLKDYVMAGSAALDLSDSEPWPEELGGQLDAWKQKAAAWKQHVAGLDDAEVGTQYAAITGSLDELKAQLRQLRLKAGALSGKSFLVSESAPYESFTGAPQPTDRPADAVEFTALQNEWVDLAWNVTNLTDQPITLRATVRHGDSKAALGYLYLGLPGLATQWRLATAVAAGDGRPVYDALAPIPAGTFTVPGGATSQVWLTVHAPQGASGAVSGRVRIEPVDGTQGEPVVLPVAATIIPADIRAERPCHTFTWNLVTSPVADDPAWLAAHLRDLADHGVDVCMIHCLRLLPRPKANADGTLAEALDFSRADALLDQAQGLFDLFYVTTDIFEKGTVRRDLFGIKWGSPAYEKAFKLWFRQLVDHLLARGLTYEQLLFNPYDESLGDDCRTLAKWMKQVDPKVQTIIDCSTPDVELAKRMDALTDVWVPHYKYHFAEDHEGFFDLLKNSGKPRWCYFYSEGSTDKAQNPTRHYLAKFWWAFSEGITGVCYWAQQYYGDPWYRADFQRSYDTSLVYPTAGAPVASRRWEAWRRGWQDYQLLHLTRSALKGSGDAEALRVFGENLDTVVAVPGDPAQAQAVRDWLRKTLVKQTRVQ